MEQHGDLSESDDESRQKKHKREHRNGSRRRSENEELEDGELGKFSQFFPLPLFSWYSM